MRYLIILGLLLTVSCAHSEAQKQIAGCLKDQALTMKNDGVKHRMMNDMVKNAEVNEKVVGSPENRLDPEDSATQEATRGKAEKDAESKWKKWLDGLLVALGILGTAAGIPALKKLS